MISQSPFIKHAFNIEIIFGLSSTTFPSAFPSCTYVANAFFNAASTSGLNVNFRPQPYLGATFARPSLTLRRTVSTQTDV